MPNGYALTLSPEKQKQIRDVFTRTRSVTKTMLECGVSEWAVRRYRGDLNSLKSFMTEEKRREVRETYDKTKNVTLTAKLCKVSKKTVRSCRDEPEHVTNETVTNKTPLSQVECLPPQTNHQTFQDDDTPEQRHRRMQDLALERDLLKEVAGEKAFRSFLHELVRGVSEPFDPQPPVTFPKSTKAHVRFPLLHLSDWHFEEIVKKEAVLDFNEYSIPIACRRVWRVVQSFIAWHNNFVSGGRFSCPELVVALNGDFLTGVLHGLERHSGAPNVVRATLACGRLIALALRDLSMHFPRVRVIGTVGNHGRLPDDKKVPTKDPTRSFDYIAYAHAQALMESHTHVEWTLPEAYGTVYEIGGHSIYQAHGNFIKQQLGIVGYGMRRTVSNLSANLGAAGRPLHYAVFGHFHSHNAAEFAGVTAFIGPSLIGTQEYGFLSGGSVNRPAQQAFIFDEKLGYVSTETFYGDGPPDSYPGTYEINF